MIRALLITSGALAALNLALAAWLIVHRLATTNRLRKLSAAQNRLRPLALAWLEDERPPVPAMTPIERTAFIDLLSRYGRSLRGFARKEVAALVAEAGVVPQLEAELRKGRWWERASAAYLMGDIGGERQAELLIEALTDQDQRVRSAAARSLGRLGAGAAVEPLVRNLATARLPKAVGAQALMAIGPVAVPVLASLLSAEEEEVRAAAAELLGRIGDRGDADRLIALLFDPSPEVRVRAARALSRAGSASAASALMEALFDPVPFVRAAVATALGHIGHLPGLDRLLDMARGDEFVAAHAAALAVGNLSPARLAEAARAVDAGPHLLEAADLATVR